MPARKDGKAAAHGRLDLERTTGIEPVYAAWEALFFASHTVLWLYMGYIFPNEFHALVVYSSTYIFTHNRTISVPKACQMRAHLTDLAIKALTPGLYLDIKLPSFGIRVGRNRKTWIVIKEPNRTKVSLGRYPDMSLSDARKKARAELAAPGTAPVPTFTAALEEFLALDRWKPYSKYQLVRNIKNYYTTNKNLDKITHREIAELIEGIKAKSQAAHTLKDLKTFFNWCVPRYISINPCLGIQTQRYKPRQRVLTDEELCTVYSAQICDQSDVSNIIRLLILTGARKGEIAALRWENISDTLTFSDTKSGKDHTIPCTPMMRDILGDPTSKTGFVYPGRTGKPFNGFHEWKRQADKLVQGFVIHDLRRTFASNWQKMGIRLEITEAALGHVGSRGGIVGVYQTYAYVDELKTHYLAWETRLKHILNI